MIKTIKTLADKVRSLCNNRIARPEVPVIDIKPHTWTRIALDVVSDLERRGLYKPGLAYRYFYRRRLSHMLRRGTDRNARSDMFELKYSNEKAADVLWVDAEKQALIEGSSCWRDVCVLNPKIRMMAVYDRSKLAPLLQSDNDRAYRRNGEFPIIIFKIHYTYLDNRDTEAYHEAEEGYREFKKRHGATN